MPEPDKPRRRPLMGIGRAAVIGIGGGIVLWLVLAIGGKLLWSVIGG